MIQPVERLDTELNSLCTLYMDGLVKRQIVVEVRTHTHIGILLAAKLADGPRRSQCWWCKARQVETLVLSKPVIRIAG